MLIESKISSYVEDDLESSLITIHSDLKIFKEELPDGNIKYQKIGSVISYYFDVGNTIDSNQSVMELFDLEQPFLECYDTLYEGNYFKDEISDQMGDILYNNLFLIQKVEVDPKYRGNNYALVALIRIIQQFAHGVGLIVLKPFPLQFEGGQSETTKTKSNYKLFVKDEKLAFSKIRRYWEKIGFQQIGDSEIWGLNPLMEHKRVMDIEYKEDF